MKKILSLVLVLVMALGLFAGCQDNTPTDPSTPAVDLAGKYEIKVWVAEDHVPLTEKLIADFNKENTDGIEIVATVEPLGEGDAATQMINDVSMGADLFTFAQDQTARLIQAGALAKLGVGAQKTVSAANASGVVAACMSGDAMYAYPLTADNGYFMYYDKSVISEDKVGTMESLIEACKAANRYISFEVEGSGWYTASYFFGAGCVSSWTTNADGKFDSVNDDWHTEKGVIAALGMQNLLQSGVWVNSSSVADFDAATKSAVVISGTWAYNDALKILGDNLGATKLPSFNVEGKDYQLGSFNGCKLMGVKPQTDVKKQAVLHLLAQYMTTEKAQLERFNALSWGPANLNAQKDEAVLANPGLAALLAQSPYSVPQGQIPDWWNVATALATAIKEAPAGDKAAIQAAQNVYREAILKLADPATQLDADQWTVIGEVGDSNWSKDLLMTKQDDGTWKTNEAYELEAGKSFKCRMGGQWATQIGAGTGPADNDDNYVVETAGKYYIVVDPANRTITLVNA